MALLLKNQTSEELHSRLGTTLRQARMIQASVIRTGKLPDPQDGLSKPFLKSLRDATEIPNLTVINKTVSPQDGFAKYLFRGDGPDASEELNAFRDALRRHLGAPVVRRYSGGKDILAACGLLSGTHSKSGF